MPSSVSQDNKTKTWPPKAPWQHPSPLPGTLPGPSAPLYAVASPGSQWSDTMQMLQSPVWAATSDCSAAASFAYVQTPPQPPPPPAHKAAHKALTLQSATLEPARCLQTPREAGQSAGQPASRGAAAGIREPPALEVLWLL